MKMKFYLVPAERVDTAAEIDADDTADHTVVVIDTDSGEITLEAED